MGNIPRRLLPDMRRWRDRGPGSTADWVIVCLAMAVLCLAIADWVINPPRTWFGMLCSLGYCLAVALLPCCGFKAAWAVVVLVSVGNLGAGLDSSGPNSTWGLLLAIVALGRNARYWEGVVAIASVVATVTVATIRFPDAMGFSVPDGIVNFAIGLFATYLVGVAVRRSDDKRKRDETERLLARTRRDIATASYFHDAVSGRLTHILVAAEKVRREHPDEYDRMGWREVEREASDALHELHRAIDAMNRESSSVDDGLSLPLADAIESVTAACDKRLKELGYTGDTQIRGVCAAVLDERADEIIALLRELYINIERHCEPSGTTYRMRIGLRPEAVTITQSNDCPRGPSRWVSPPASGSGLRLHRARIESFGGEMRTNRDDGQWHVFCRMPLA
ncbi:signal transduction histidine kinase [Bifidobacterium lemurum]|uniref:Signal transduction histidine kinase n=2 Tax=Bifidobacterium lemurum TaxID=1603886 RepID=A0A261FLZ0_9BIFI|nr:signal transduction histidine kinase [Bifidobacterium lemurum]